MKHTIRGLVAATHTPFRTDGSLNLEMVRPQAEHLKRIGVETVFIGGSTGESHSLSLEERLALAEMWAAVCRATGTRLVVHVGSNCLRDARAMAAQAEKLGAEAIAATAPSYFKPASVDALVGCSAEIAAAAPSTPFYCYDIPAMTGVDLSMPAFLDAAADRIPTLAGLKFTNRDMAAFQRCLHLQDGRFDILWGVDEWMGAAFALGATGAVGSTYNFAAPIYLRVIDAVERGDLAAMRVEQYRSVQLITLLIGYGFMAAAKAVMGFVGVDVGAPRLPNTPLSPERVAQLRQDLLALGFFEWVRV